MVAVTFNRTVHVDTGRDFTPKRQAGVPLLLTDFHAGQAPRSIFTQFEPFELVQRYRGDPLGQSSLVIVWLAGLGDTISLIPGLTALTEANPDACIGIVTIPVLYEIIESAGIRSEFIEYPPQRSAIEQYDWMLPIEGMSELRSHREQDSITVYARLLGQPDDVPLVHFSPNPRARERMRLPPATRPRIAVQARGLSPIRTYPIELVADLLKMLVRRGYEVHLMGQRGDCDIVSSPPRIYNACGTTTTFGETVAYLQQMDALICPDSFFLHLGGALNIPTVALMSTVPASLRCSRYPSVAPLEPDFHCAPCMMTSDERCPQGHSDCHALRSPSMRPARVFRMLEKALERRSVPMG